jgi:hypothetical protein
LRRTSSGPAALGADTAADDHIGEQDDPQRRGNGHPISPRDGCASVVLGGQ